MMNIDINTILISIFLLITIYTSIRTLYLAKKDNYNMDDYSLKNTGNNLLKFLNIAALIFLAYVFLSKTFPPRYEEMVLIFLFINFCLVDFYVQYKHSKRTKKTGKLVPYAILIIFFIILFYCKFLES